MNNDDLYNYLKLLIPNDLKIEKKEFGVNVGVDLSSRYGFAFADSYRIENNYIVLSRLGRLPDYASKIFGKPKFKTNDYVVTDYYFEIPEELKED